VHQFGAHWCNEGSREDRTPEHQSSEQTGNAGAQHGQSSKVKCEPHAPGTDRGGIEAEKRKQQEFFDLAERFRNERDPEAAKRLGDQLGRMVFGG
jgi:hypothetical protein